MYRIKLTNETDANNAQAGVLLPRQVRTLELEAEFDPRATFLSLPAEAVAALGLPLREWRRIQWNDASYIELPVARSLDVEILGRGMTCDALVLPAGSTPVIGRRELATLDLTLDPDSRELVLGRSWP
jgi:hypothetical protein